MRLEYQILIAVALDLALGDPQWLPHPVRGIGRLALCFEALSRRVLGSTRLAGLCAALSTYIAVGAAAWGVIRLAAAIHPAAADVASILIIYTTIAARDLARHSMAVFRSLAAGHMDEARRRVGAIVGRDTDRLDESDVIRAAVESVAESTVDGVTAPLMFAVVAGPVGAMVYRAVNTLDSMFGHRDERYRQFGWVAARIDDLANYIPARCTAPLVCMATLLLRLAACLQFGPLSLWERVRVRAGKVENAPSPRNVPSLPSPPAPLPKGEGSSSRHALRPGLALRTLLRDGRKHTSPNAGLTEAAMAGALGVQLGGVNYYDGQPLEKPTIGEAAVPLSPRHIRLANALMFVSAGLFLAVCFAVRAETLQLLSTWRTVR
jgi:adenosylcobinamide-phosphate synthase